MVDAFDACLAYQSRFKAAVVHTLLEVNHVVSEGVHWRSSIPPPKHEFLRLTKVLLLMVVVYNETY